MRNYQIKADLREELGKVPLRMRGMIPPWLSGTLVRNGPVFVEIDGKKLAHWFDGLAMLHAFSFAGGKVEYANKFLRTEAYKSVYEKGSLNYRGFATDPCRTIFKQLITLFIPKSYKLYNANINVTQIADAYVALTEIPLPVQFDLQTLQTLGVLDYQDSLPHHKCWESAHPHTDLDRKEYINYLIDYGHKSHYVIYKMQDGERKRKVFARIPVDEPSYMHSFSVTENYVVLTEYPFLVKPLDFVTKNRPFIENYTWHPERGTRFLVIDKNNGKVFKEFRTKAFFCFHHVNAFEQNGMLYLDMVAYDDTQVISEVAQYYHLASRQPFALTVQTRVERFALNLENADVSSQVLHEEYSEFPRINPHYDGRAYRYIYLVDPRLPQESTSTQPIYKFNIETRQMLLWQEAGCTPGEAVFVPHPEAKSEDDGVVLTVILDCNRLTSFLLILDGKTLEEVGRAEVPHAIPLGLHGQFFN